MPGSTSSSLTLARSDHDQRKRWRPTRAGETGACFPSSSASRHTHPAERAPTRLSNRAPSRAPRVSLRSALCTPRTYSQCETHAQTAPRAYSDSKNAVTRAISRINCEISAFSPLRVTARAVAFRPALQQLPQMCAMCRRSRRSVSSIKHAQIYLRRHLRATYRTRRRRHHSTMPRCLA